MIDDARFVERPSFFDGQRLFASDLADVDAFNREMREIHNRSLHQPGIGRGCAVYGRRGDREVVVQPGYVLDSDGHEIILTETHVEPLPPVAGDGGGASAYFDLTVSYPADEDLEAAEARTGLCQTRGAVRLREAPVFCWIPLERAESGELQAKTAQHKSELALGRRIKLARVEVLNCQLRSLDLAGRRNARPVEVPRIAGDSAIPAWSLWVEDHTGNGGGYLIRGLYADVDTSGAGFSTLPNYLARIDGPRPLVVQDTFAYDGLAFIKDATATGFTLVVPLLHEGDLQPWSILNLDEPVLAAHSLYLWRVVWVGVEG